VLRDASPRASPQNNLAIHHRARPVYPENHRATRKLARLRDQPIDIVPRDETTRRDGHDLRAAPRAPGLNLSDLIPVQQHLVSPAPASKRVYLPTRLDPQSRSHSLLYSHRKSPLSLFSCSEGPENIRKFLNIVKNYFRLALRLFS
jgi:hypothetical protein